MVNSLIFSVQEIGGVLAFFSEGPWDDDDEISTDTNGSAPNPSGTNSSSQTFELNDVQKHQLRHRELFLTRQTEILLATNIRGKCLVTLHNETEAFVSYLNSEVRFFFRKGNECSDWF